MSAISLGQQSMDTGQEAAKFQNGFVISGRNENEEDRTIVELVQMKSS